ncbi:M48 family metalloprotease [Pigmentiphaga litoralis]|uniref:Putative Zn-dependent protease n=1 Tax=Pigmentiphaga litoralis TaxID=516702 RepID=A0A7Y9IY53_9BURK|nr:M48 family metalloprotease [Pigmentiphaga litoralis]NYE26053.1 putative Zn-dependent protease [Pigmentiphaga litoralis]NYE85173.1 putative Zn-dependent protease [Pigmentiphaga litoralis]
MVTPTRFPLLARNALACALLPVLLALPAPVWLPGASVAHAQPAGLPDLGESSADELSPRLERRLGEAIMAQSLTDPDYIDDPDISQYLNTMASNLSAHAPSDTQQIHVFPVRDASVNAFAMPGGFIGINAGLVVAAQSESELAGVMAHEIGHVVQRHVARGLVQQKQTSIIMVAALLAALVAARGNSQAPEAAMAFGQAAAIDAQLGFSREAEREADRTGFQMLSASGYDVNGMATFFGRLMALSSVNERTSTSFTRTHPLSIERMSDMQNRARSLSTGAAPPPSPPDFYFVRAKLRVLQAASGQDTIDAIRFLESRAMEATTGIEKAAAYYGVGVGYLRRRDYAKAQEAYDKATSGARDHVMLAGLAIDIATAQGNADKALTLSRAARERWPQQISLAFDYADALQRTGRHSDAVVFLNEQISRYPDQPRFRQMLATSYGGLQQPVAERRAMAEFYSRTGAMSAAVELLTQARGMSKDFYEQSQIDAQLRELQRRVKEENDMLKRFKS